MGDESEDGVGGQTNPGDSAERDQWQCPWNWEAAVEKAKELAYDDPRSDSDAMVMGVDGSQGPELSLHDETTNFPPNTLRRSAPHTPAWNAGHEIARACCWVSRKVEAWASIK